MKCGEITPLKVSIMHSKEVEIAQWGENQPLQKIKQKNVETKCNNWCSFLEKLSIILTSGSIPYAGEGFFYSPCGGIAWFTTRVAYPSVNGPEFSFTFRVNNIRCF